MCLRDLLRYICLQKCQICNCSKCCLPARGMCGWFSSVFDIASQNSRHKQLRHTCACQISCGRRRAKERIVLLLTAAVFIRNTQQLQLNRFV